MKIRSGFVSNSSSSSFIIKNGDIKEISLKMLKIIIKDYYGWYDNEESKKEEKLRHKRWTSNLKNILKKKEVIDGKIGITMPSCNEDTYIILNNNDLYITTCNNHDWYFNETNHEYTSDYDKIHNLINGCFFYNVRNGLMHSYLLYGDYTKEDTICKKCNTYCNSYVVDKNGNKICGNCFEGELGLTDEQLMKNARENIKNPISSLDIK